MNRHLVTPTVLLLFVAVVLYACVSPASGPVPATVRPPGAPGSAHSSAATTATPGTPTTVPSGEWAVVSLALDPGAIHLNQPATATVSVCANEDLPGAKAYLTASGSRPSGLESRREVELGDLHPGECRQATFTFQVAEWGYINFLAGVVGTGNYTIASSQVRLKVSDQGVVLNPTPEVPVDGVYLRKLYPGTDVPIYPPRGHRSRRPSRLSRRLPRSPSSPRNHRTMAPPGQPARPP